jgi:hypothetical protein
MKPTQDDMDMRLLVHRAEFRRFLLRVAKDAGIWIPTAGAEHTLHYREGQRSLGLDILRKAAAGLPQRDAGIEQVLALILAESTPKETSNASDDPDIDEPRR